MRKGRDACKCMYMCGDVPIMSPHVMLALPPNISKPYGRLRPPTARCNAALSRAPALQIARPHQTSPPSGPLARNLEALAETLGATLVSAVGASLGPRLCRPGAQPCLLPSSAAESTTSAPSPEKKTRNEKISESLRKSGCSETDVKFPMPMVSLGSDVLERFF